MSAIRPDHGRTLYRGAASERLRDDGELDWLAESDLCVGCEQRHAHEDMYECSCGAWTCADCTSRERPCADLACDEPADAAEYFHREDVSW